MKNHPTDIHLSPQAAAQWKSLSTFERRGIEIAVRHLALRRLRMRAAPFSIADKRVGVGIEGEMGDWGAEIRITALTSLPEP